MTLKTNLTLLIPGRRYYCDYAITMEEVGNGKATGQWMVIDYMPTPTREGYTKFNSFPSAKGDAFLDKGSAPGYHMFFFDLGYLKSSMSSVFANAHVHVEMDVKEHMFSPGKGTWAKKAELIPSMEEAIAIFWK